MSRADGGIFFVDNASRFCQSVPVLISPLERPNSCDQLLSKRHKPCGLTKLLSSKYYLKHLIVQFHSKQAILWAEEKGLLRYRNILEFSIHIS